ncbi:MULTISPECIES: ribbon-helix-helix protein, CopG family [Caldilinea]|jgi:predicted DNA-binding protein|uniref:Ribbon-helix-helix protein CopG domain-containing protein n=2 Tax=Caldilinea aerophila TaxID=133453 RepID=I0I2W3_CALAS|nr:MULTISPECIES: ribbon-helix-helix protein, CopG family [Caldilinea]MBO9392482.1 ribbon-helix-helix protein, CopG family [Caldilinea sp.]BAL99600.1 hypothetical protein CLDAP_15610 [Caldilinea aerophila DSM 14535 = NBRC 104270]GIV73802.1 MAG: hypothetical protein KatS3mg049_2358 [Caldilinea sp.]
MDRLSERLEIRLSSATLQRLRQESQGRGISVGELVREAIERFLEEERQSRLEAAMALFRIEAPVADWEIMEQEIEAAHLGARENESSLH